MQSGVERLQNTSSCCLDCRGNRFAERRNAKGRRRQHETHEEHRKKHVRNRTQTTGKCGNCPRPSEALKAMGEVKRRVNNSVVPGVQQEASAVDMTAAKPLKLFACILRTFITCYAISLCHSSGTCCLLYSSKVALSSLQCTLGASAPSSPSTPSATTSINLSTTPAVAMTNRTAAPPRIQQEQLRRGRSSCPEHHGRFALPLHSPHFTHRCRCLCWSTTTPKCPYVLDMPVQEWAAGYDVRGVACLRVTHDPLWPSCLAGSCTRRHGTSRTS